jgi:hypothetical protein
MKCSMVVALSMCPPTFIFACERRKPRKLLNICMLLYIVLCTQSEEQAQSNTILAK